MRKKIVAGNWKMNLDQEAGAELIKEFVELSKNDPFTADMFVIAPPFVHLATAALLLSHEPHIALAAQNCHQEEKGAFTGEISASMLVSFRTQFVIIGHSERRQYFGETNELLAQKTKAVLSHGMNPIFCCGESLEIREAGSHLDFVANQLTESLFDLSESNFEKLVIAYEPIWAIGTGKTATAAQAQEMHAHLRQHIAKKYGQKIAENTSILYGGSCKPSNATELFANPDVDGGLIGGASLKAHDFFKIGQSF